MKSANVLVNSNYSELEKQERYYLDQVSKYQQKRMNCTKELEQARSFLFIECACGYKTQIKDLEIIEEDRGTSSYNYDDNWEPNIRRYYVCTSCTEVFNAPEDKELSPAGITKYTEKVIKWTSTLYKAPPRVAELLEPSMTRAEEARKLKDKNERIEAAKKLLQQEGIL